MENEKAEGGDVEMFGSATGFCKEMLLEHVDESESHLVDELMNNADYVGRKLVTNISVPGNIGKQEFREFWMEKLKPTDLVKGVVTEGYRLLKFGKLTDGVHLVSCLSI